MTTYIIPANVDNIHSLHTHTDTHMNYLTPLTLTSSNDYMGSYLRYINTRKQDDLATLILTGYQVIRMNELIVTGTYDNTRDNMCNILLLVVYTTDTLTGDNTEVCTNTQQSYRHVCKANEYIDSYGVDRALLTRMSMISGGDIISGIKLYLHTHTHIRPANEGDTHIHSHR